MAGKGGGDRHVFMDVKIGDRAIGRMVFQLFWDDVPKTCANFKALCTGEKGMGPISRKPLHYKNSIFHRLIAGFMLQGGDITRGDGTGGECIYGSSFADESMKTSRHNMAGLLSMANAGPNTNSSQFFISFAATPWLDGKHVVFGRLVEGMQVLRMLEKVPTGQQDRPRQPILISDCGEIDLAAAGAGAAGGAGGAAAAAGGLAAGSTGSASLRARYGDASSSDTQLLGSMGGGLMGRGLGAAGGNYHDDEDEEEGGEAGPSIQSLEDLLAQNKGAAGGNVGGAQLSRLQAQLGLPVVFGKGNAFIAANKKQRMEAAAAAGASLDAITAGAAKGTAGSASGAGGSSTAGQKQVREATQESRAAEASLASLIKQQVAAKLQAAAAASGGSTGTGSTAAVGGLVLGSAVLKGSTGSKLGAGSQGAAMAAHASLHAVLQQAREQEQEQEEEEEEEEAGEGQASAVRRRDTSSSSAEDDRSSSPSAGHSSRKKTDSGSGADNESSEAQSAYQSRLFALRLRMNAGRKDNMTEVVKEHRRQADPQQAAVLEKAEAEAAELARRRQLKQKQEQEGQEGSAAGAGAGDGTGAAAGEEGGASEEALGGRKRRRGEGGADEEDRPARLLEPAEMAEAKHEEMKAKEERKWLGYGWNSHNQDAKFRGYERKLAMLPGSREGGGSGSSLSVAAAAGGLAATALPGEALPAAAALSYGKNDSVDPAGLDRLMAELKKQDQRLRRKEKKGGDGAAGGAAPGASVDHINEGNRAFNEKVERQWGKYTVDIKQALERGTAL